jgi:hypothetical protein
MRVCIHVGNNIVQNGILILYENAKPDVLETQYMPNALPVKFSSQIIKVSVFRGAAFIIFRCTAIC